MVHDLTNQDRLLHAYTPCVAIVTGAAQGIGLAIAHRLAKDGFDIVVNGRPGSPERLEAVAEEIRRQYGRRAIIAPADVSKESDVIDMVEKTVQELGSVDVVRKNSLDQIFDPFG